MNWVDCGSFVEITPPKDFNFKECLVFLGRSEHEILHRIHDGHLLKLIKIENELVLLRIGEISNIIRIEFPAKTPTQAIREKTAAYAWEWFDMSQELEPFYEMANKDMILHKIVNRYRGLRIIGIPDLFEALTWAILGQQINLTFAYTLKKRFVEQFGESFIFQGNSYWIFPVFETIADISVEELKKLQFTTRKAEYIIGVAQLMKHGQMKKAELLKLPDYQQVKNSLMAIRGVGAWTADYVMMKSLHCNAAFPRADVGLQNAIKLQLELDESLYLRRLKSSQKYGRAGRLMQRFTYGGPYMNSKLYQIDYESPIGVIEVIGTEEAVCSIMFSERERAENFIENGIPESLKLCYQELDEYFKGIRYEFSFPYIFEGTDFQKKVWNALKAIPFAKTGSYKDIAVSVGNEKAIRAVGSANGRNKLSIVIPCHRIIGSNGKLTGYAGGLWRKEWLLQHEKNVYGPGLHTIREQF